VEKGESAPVRKAVYKITPKSRTKVIKVRGSECVSSFHNHILGRYEDEEKRQGRDKRREEPMLDPCRPTFSAIRINGSLVEKQMKGKKGRTGSQEVLTTPTAW